MMDKNTLRSEAIKWRTRFYKGQKAWSIAHHVSLFGSIICSLVAGAMLQLNQTGHTGLAALFTSIAAALTGIATSGGFERKWRSNRLSRSRVDGLLIDLEDHSISAAQIATELKAIINSHDFEIVNEKRSAKEMPADGEGSR